MGSVPQVKRQAEMVKHRKRKRATSAKHPARAATVSKAPMPPMIDASPGIRVRKRKVATRHPMRLSRTAPANLPNNPTSPSPVLDRVQRKKVVTAARKMQADRTASPKMASQNRPARKTAAAIPKAKVPRLILRRMPVRMEARQATIPASESPARAREVTRSPRGSSSDDASGQPGKSDQSPQDSQGGTADSSSARKGNSQGTMDSQEGEPGEDDPNLEYAKKATDLVLEYLRDQKNKPDANLLENSVGTRTT